MSQLACYTTMLYTLTITTTEFTYKFQSPHQTTDLQKPFLVFIQMSFTDFAVTKQKINNHFVFIFYIECL